MVVMTVACGDSGRSKTKRAGVEEKAATKNGLGLRTTQQKARFKQLSTLAVGTEPRVICAHVHRGSTFPRSSTLAIPLHWLSCHRCESAKLEALAAWAIRPPEYPLPCARYRDIITCSNLVEFTIVKEVSQMFTIDLDLFY